MPAWAPGTISCPGLPRNRPPSWSSGSIGSHEIKAAARAPATRCGPPRRTMLPSCARTPSARPTTWAGRPSARPTRSGPPSARGRELTSTAEREVAKLRPRPTTRSRRSGPGPSAISPSCGPAPSARSPAQGDRQARARRDPHHSKRQADEMRARRSGSWRRARPSGPRPKPSSRSRFAARREEAERQEAERLAAAQSATQKPFPKPSRRLNRGAARGQGQRPGRPDPPGRRPARQAAGQ